LEIEPAVHAGDDLWQQACEFAVSRRHQQRIRFGVVTTRIVKILVSLVSQSSSFDHCHCQALITVTVTRHHLESGRPPSTTHFGSAGPPSHNLMAIDRDLVADSSGVSVVVTKEPDQPLATLLSTGTTSFHDMRK